MRIRCQSSTQCLLSSWQWLVPQMQHGVGTGWNWVEYDARAGLRQSRPADHRAGWRVAPSGTGSLIYCGTGVLASWYWWGCFARLSSDGDTSGGVATSESEGGGMAGLLDNPGAGARGVAVTTRSSRPWGVRWCDVSWVSQVIEAALGEVGWLGSPMSSGGGGSLWGCRGVGRVLRARPRAGARVDETEPHFTLLQARAL